MPLIDKVLPPIVSYLWYNEKMEAREKKRHLGGWICLVVLIVALGVAFWQREWIYDFYLGVTYQPSSEMARIRGDLGLTERGEFLFNAAQPALNEAEEFNSHCREGGSEIAVLGCYANGKIYIYNITDERLAGIRELTSAHELLHANWARMSEADKTALTEPLTRTFEANQEMLGEEIDPYDIGEKQEELYVRAGTEIKDLPGALERHYAEIFEDQDRIVAYYDSYIEVFRALEAEMAGLKTEMDEISTVVETKLAEYERRAKQLDADIVSFNSCAKVAGCFSSESEFYNRRGELMAEQETLGEMYNEINGLIETYNAKVEIYNADVSQSEKLNTIINSAARPQEVGV